MNTEPECSYPAPWVVVEEDWPFGDLPVRRWVIRCAGSRVVTTLPANERASARRIVDAVNTAAELDEVVNAMTGHLGPDGKPTPPDQARARDLISKLFVKMIVGRLSASLGGGKLGT